MTLHTQDGHKLHTIHWLPPTAPKAVIALVHGINEHSGRYHHVAQALTAADYAVHSYDHLGHGQSDGRRVYFEDLEQPVRHLRQFIQHVREDYPDLPFFLYGHSMGSLISLLYTLESQDTLNGVILTGLPLHLTKIHPAFLPPASAILDKLVPTLPVAPFSSDGISRDAAVRAAFEHDPLVYHGAVRVRMGHFLFSKSVAAQQHLDRLKLPLLLIHGSEDSLCPPSGSQALYEQVSASDKTLHILPGLYHEVHNEPEQGHVLSLITDWLALHL